jgi:hypothetical protein
LHELSTERANSLRFARSVSVVSQYTTLPVAFSADAAAAAKAIRCSSSCEIIKIVRPKANRSSLDTFGRPIAGQKAVPMPMPRDVSLCLCGFSKCHRGNQVPCDRRARTDNAHPESKPDAFQKREIGNDDQRAEHEAPEWQAATESLILVATPGEPTMFARIGVMRALSAPVRVRRDRPELP